MDERLEIEVEVTTVSAAKKMLVDVRNAFGEDTFVKIKIGGEDKSKTFSLLNDMIKQTAEEVKNKLRRKE